ncbi:hypothetical protein IWX90DRAFT_382516 [Phyllosticta citrichinensis]|uniref:VASt domain-containing protein n=1 Tax=Phyllosticta citrichinensis TaxID=1130410 RepID=A0ABR1XZJ7_9PEZI
MDPSFESLSRTSSGRSALSKVFSGRRRKHSDASAGSKRRDDGDSGSLRPMSTSKPRSSGDSQRQRLNLANVTSSSLITSDSDSEAPPVRPPLSPHQSHAGYLTLSSPLIASQILDAAIISPSPYPDDIRSIVTTADTVAPKQSSTLEPQSKERRGSSPGRKLKGAFGGRKSPSPRGTPDTLKASGSGGGGGGLGSLLGRKSRSSSKVSLLEEGTQDSAQGDQVQGHLSPPRSDPSQTSQAEPQRADTSTVVPETTPDPGAAEAPTTLLTPPTPTDGLDYTSLRPATSSRAEPSHSQPASNNPDVIVTPSGSLIHRRARSATTSNQPGKLAHAGSSQLTPTAEETRTPGGTLTSPPSGFFSSVFSAASNAASSFTNIANLNQNQRKQSASLVPEPNVEKTGPAGGEEVISGGSSEAEQIAENPKPEKKQLAVETLGSGDLSLSHLGIQEIESDQSVMNSFDELAPARPITPTVIPDDDAAARSEDSAAAKAVSASYLQEPPDSAFVGHKPKALTTLSGVQTPPRPLGDESETRPRRSGSVRSRLSDRKSRRRHRNSSNAGTTLTPAVTSSTTTLPGATSMGVVGGSKLTGFAVAPAKRNREFHGQFKSVPDDDYLIEDYSAALQRDILLHGRLYVSEGHICFASNILGWVTNLIISFDEVVSIEKKSTAVIFPNAIVITTLHARNVFASLVSRDSTYDLLIGIWKISHPNLKSSLNGVALDNGTGDKTEKDDIDNAIEDVSEEGSDDEVYDEDDEDEEAAASVTDHGDGSIAGSEIAEPAKAISRKASSQPLGATTNGAAPKDNGNIEPAPNGAPASQGFPGPTAHAETSCGDEAEHFSNLLMDTTIPAPLGKVYSLMFGPMSGTFMRKWLIEDQKSQDLQMEDDKQGLCDTKKTFNYSFIKPLNASIGPKQTKCIINQTLDQFDLERAVTVTCSTQNPDVPNGNIFVVKTKYCLTWGPGNSTRLVMNHTIEWSGKSWLKGPIEKGTNDGQGVYAKDLMAALRAACSAKPIAKAATGGKIKNKKGRKKGAAATSPEIATAAPLASADKGGDWGLLEPLHGPLRPITDLMPGFVSAQVVVLFLGLLLFTSWLRGGAPAAGRNISPYGLATPARIAAYEEMWRREESELWDWLEERVRMDRTTPMTAGQGPSRRASAAMGQKVLAETERMSQRQIEEAIRVTQNKLETLREAVERQRDRTWDGAATQSEAATKGEESPQEV